jgi:S-adenosylmethionine hydrolase
MTSNHLEKQVTRVISLLTDFGLKDEYVGVMKGVILCHFPTAQLVDITHAIPPQNILLAARTIESSYSFFPEATIHLVVVDPGVGTDRSIVVLEAANHLFIAPDNGVLTPLLLSDLVQRCFVLEKSTDITISTTFHGRDLMAPLAGRLAAGMDVRETGQQINAADCCRIDIPKATVTADTIIGEIVGIDNFGNIATSVSADDLKHFSGGFNISVAGTTINKLSRCYAEMPHGELLCLIDSRGYLEIARNCGNASDALQCKVGDAVVVQRDHLLE